MELDLKYNPKNSLIAIFYFLFGSFFIWWSHDKIVPLASVFDNTLPKAMIWLNFIFLYAIWLIFIPYLSITGKDISVGQFLKTFYYGIIGVVMVIVILPIMQTIITALTGIFENAIITGLAWIVTFIAIIYFSYYKPIESIYDTT